MRRYGRVPCAESAAIGPDGREGEKAHDAAGISHFSHRHRTGKLCARRAGPAPVSYTHLDVYKRQVRWFQGVIVFEHGYSSGYTQDGIVGELTMQKLDDVVGRIV